MSSDDGIRDPIDHLMLLEVNPQKFKSMFNKFIGERIDGTGLTESQAMFLIHLDKTKGMSLKELTDRVGVHKSLTTRMVRTLTEEGFVINNSGSGKEYDLVLTKQGASAKKVVDAAFKDLFKVLLGDLTQDEILSLYRIFVKVRKTMLQLIDEHQE